MGFYFTMAAIQNLIQLIAPSGILLNENQYLIHRLLQICDKIRIWKQLYMFLPLVKKKTTSSELSIERLTKELVLIFGKFPLSFILFNFNFIYSLRPINWYMRYKNNNYLHLYKMVRGSYINRYRYLITQLIVTKELIRN